MCVGENANHSYALWPEALSKLVSIASSGDAPNRTVVKFEYNIRRWRLEQIFFQFYSVVVND